MLLPSYVIWARQLGYGLLHLQSDSHPHIGAPQFRWAIGNSTRLLSSESFRYGIYSVSFTLSLRIILRQDVITKAPNTGFSFPYLLVNVYRKGVPELDLNRKPVSKSSVQHLCFESRQIFKQIIKESFK